MASTKRAKRDPGARRANGSGTLFQRANGRWVGRVEVGFTAGGSRRFIEVSGVDPDDVKDRLDAKRLQIQREGTPEAGTARTRVHTWATQWLEITQRTVRPKTWATDRSAVTRWIIPTIGHRELTALTPADIRSVILAVEQAGRSSSTALRVQVVLTKMLKDAIVEGHSVKQRVLMVSAPSAGANDRDAVDYGHALDLLKAAALRADGSRWVAALLQGMRQGECLGLTWDAVDLDKGTLDVSWQLQSLPYTDRTRTKFRVPRNYEARQLWKAFHLVRPKTQKGYRVIPLTPWMVAALTQWRSVAPASPYGLVWPRENGLPQDTKVDTARWRDLQDEAQVAAVDGTQGRRYVLHEARHTTATLLMEAGVSDVVTTAILGHSSITVSRGYQHAADRHTRQAMEAISARFGLIGSGDEA